MSKSLNRVRSALETAGLVIRILEMPGETRTAADAAREAACHLDQIAKSIIFRGDESGAVLVFVTAGGNQVSPEKAADAAGEPLGRADAAFVRATTGFAIGGVAPIGHLTDPNVFVDPRLLDFEAVFAAAGTPRHIFEISPRHLIRISNAQLVDFAV